MTICDNTCLLSAARTASISWAPVEHAVSAVHVAVTRVGVRDIRLQSYCPLHPLEEGIDLAVAATLGGASKHCDQAQGEN